jgi:hypothetical protein
MHVISDKHVDERMKQARIEEWRYERSFESKAGKNVITNQLTKHKILGYADLTANIRVRTNRTKQISCNTNREEQKFVERVTADRYAEGKTQCKEAVMLSDGYVFSMKDGKTRRQIRAS